MSQGGKGPKALREDAMSLQVLCFALSSPHHLVVQENHTPTDFLFRSLKRRQMLMSSSVKHGALDLVDVTV